VTVSEEFTDLTGQYRGELLALCYRMLGSAEEAEDLVQETYLRAWRSYAGFEGRSSMRTWLYRIATNVCLTALERSGRRPLPSGLGAPADDPAAELVAGPEVPWLQPVPDVLLAGEKADPASITASRAGVRLAFVAALQYLSARLRAAISRCPDAFQPARSPRMRATIVSLCSVSLWRECALGAADIVLPTVCCRRSGRCVCLPPFAQRRAEADRSGDVSWW
jgi:RNA polymerase sigma-70 factor (TIGR02960 family)